MSRIWRFAAGFSVIAQLLPVAGWGDWPQWGGAGRDFQLAAERVAPWSEAGPLQLWARELGAGYSGIVADPVRLYTMTRKGEREVVIALSRDTGETQWQHAYDAPVPESVHLDTTYGAGPNGTPLLANGRLYTLGFTGMLRCVDAESGSLVWAHDLATEFEVPIPFFGHSSSPIRFENRVIVMAGGAHAFDLETGELAWKNREFEASYASPILTRRGEQDLLIAPVAGEIVGLDPVDGRLLWRHEHLNHAKTILSGPVLGEDDRLFVSAYFLGSVGLQLAKDGRGVTKVWETGRLQLSQNNSIRVGDTLYGFHNSILIALDVDSGEVLWRSRDFEKSNLIRVGERFLLFDRWGKLSLVTLDATGVRRLAEAQILESRSWTVPTVAGGKLYVRNLETISAWDLRRTGRVAPGLEPVATDRRRQTAPAPAAFLETKKALLGAFHAGDREGMASAAGSFDAWREDPALAGLARYYQGFAAYQRALLSERAAGAALLREAEAHLEASLEVDREFADAHALLSLLYPTYWRYDRNRAAVVTVLADEHLREALRFGPDNPLVLAIAARDVFYTPADHGGNPERGMAELRRAIAAFEDRPPVALDSPAPDWGHASAWLWLGRMIERQAEGDAAEEGRAVEAYRAALELEPDLVAARDRIEGLVAAQRSD